LERKVFVKIALITMAALLAVFLLQGFARGYAGEFTVGLVEMVFGMQRERALALYDQMIRGNLEYILLASVVVIVLVLSRFLLSQFSKYFGEISHGLDVLVGDRDREIRLSPEMVTMESKLKAIRRTIEEREREARSAEQRKNDVVMYLAHDIKTPLTSVIGYLSLLDEAPDIPPDQRAKYMRITLEKANRLEKLVDEFFEITRYNLQTDAPSKENIDLSYMLAQMTDEFFPLLTAEGKRADLHIPEEMTIYGDPDKLARVFNNVLKNAVAYSPGGSVIDITAAVSGGTASIVFSNDGSIPKEKLVSIFDKFYRLDSARSTGAGGAGLGLAIAKEIVVSHGGRIYADSDGERTSFTVELPGAPERTRGRDG
jgi:two-component system sensor histidine kinase VanS